MYMVTHHFRWSQEHCKSGEALLKRLERWEDVSSAQLQVYEVKVRSFWVHLRDFSQRVEDTKDKIDKTVKLYEFFDKVKAMNCHFRLVLSGPKMYERNQEMQSCNVY